MNTGMLWLDTDQRRTLEEKVTRAAAYYLEKSGRMPELCLVNKRSLAEERTVGAIHVRPVKNMVEHHFLLGFDSAN